MADEADRRIASRYTDGSYLARHADWHAADAPWKAAHVLRMLRRHDLHPARIADAGCGAGEVLARLQRELPPTTTLTGFDLSPDAIALAAARSSERLTFRQEDVSRWDGEPFDLLLALDVFEHVPDYLGFLSALRAAARRFVFHVPLELSAKNVLSGGALRRSLDVFGHLHYFTRATALAALEHAGYAIVDWSYTASGVELASPTLGNRVLKLPRRALFAVAPELCVRLLGGYSLLVLAEGDRP